MRCDGCDTRQIILDPEWHYLKDPHHPTGHLHVCGNCWERRKYRIEKRNGSWWVYGPYDRIPFTECKTHGEALQECKTHAQDNLPESGMMEGWFYP